MHKIQYNAFIFGYCAQSNNVVVVVAAVVAIQNDLVHNGNFFHGYYCFGGKKSIDG